MTDVDLAGATPRRRPLRSKIRRQPRKALDASARTFGRAHRSYDQRHQLDCRDHCRRSYWSDHYTGDYRQGHTGSAVQLGRRSSWASISCGSSTWSKTTWASSKPDRAGRAVRSIHPEMHRRFLCRADNLGCGIRSNRPDCQGAARRVAHRTFFSSRLCRGGWQLPSMPQARREREPPKAIVF